jgi:hypothetical protein
MNELYAPLPSSLFSGKVPAKQILKFLDTYRRGSPHGLPPVFVLPAPYQFPRVEYTTTDNIGSKDHIQK